MGKKNKGKGGSGGLWDKAQNLANQTVEGAQEWNDYAHDTAQGAQDYAQNNDFSRNAADYQGAILGGDISRNPFMGTINRVTSGLNPGDALGWLQSYSGDPNSPGPGGRPAPNPANRRSSSFRYSSDRGGTGPSSRNQPPHPKPDGGVVPDTVGGQDTFFAQQMRDLFDPKHLDPANDPTLQPVIDAIQREAGEDYFNNLSGLTASAQGGGRYGSGLYQAMRMQQADEQSEGVSSAIANQLMGAYQAQQGRRMEGLGMTNTRDLGAMQDLTNRYGIDSQAASARMSASMAAGAQQAAIDAQMQDAAENRRLQAMGMSLDAQLGMLGLAGNMGSVLQQGQSDAMNAGIGYGNLGMSGYNTGLQAGQLGLGSLQMIGGVAQGMANAANQRDQMAYQREMGRYNNQQDALNDYLNLIMGVGGMGGTSVENSPGAGVSPNLQDPMAAGIMGGIGTGMNIYGGLNQ